MTSAEGRALDWALDSAHHLRTSCRACLGDDLRLVLDLGEMPLANAFPRTAEACSAEDRYPLRLYFCRACSLVQLLDVISPEILFREYIYVTGTSDTMAAHNLAYARQVGDMLRLTGEDLVVEVASNDGSLLSNFRDLGAKTLGIEPATNIARLASDRGLETVPEFFTAALAEDLLRDHGPARALIGNNVLAHVDDTRDFLAGCRTLLAEDGMLMVEVPYVREMLERVEYDTIYHEHLCYFSVSTLARLCDSVGLALVRVDRVPVHGGSLRVFAAKKRSHPTHAVGVRRWMIEERRIGLDDFQRYRRFAEEAEDQRRRLRELLDGLVQSGESLAGYGAPAKGNTLLNYCEIGTDVIPFTVDRNPLKVGRFTPGTHIPVLPISEIERRKPGHLVVLAWNFAEEIMRQQSDHRSRGGRFIIPVPKPEILL